MAKGYGRTKTGWDAFSSRSWLRPELSLSGRWMAGGAVIAGSPVGEAFDCEQAGRGFR